MNLAKLARVLADNGLSGEIIANVLGAMGEDNSSDADDKTARRRERDRERQRAHRALKAQSKTDSVTVCRTDKSVTSVCDVTLLSEDVTEDVTRTTSCEHAPSHTQVVNPSLPSLRSEEVTPFKKPSVSPSPKTEKPFSEPAEIVMFDDFTIDVIPAKPKRRASGSRSRRCPADWSPSPKHSQLADSLGFTPSQAQVICDIFRDHEFKDPKTDWDAAFSNWLRRDAGRNPHHDQQSTSTFNGSGVAARSRWSGGGGPSPGGFIGVIARQRGYIPD